MVNLKEEVFNVLRENLVAFKPEYRDKDVVLCPICLREITREQAISGGIEHIIPQSVAERDSEAYKSVATKNQRCGITLLCREQRQLKSGGKDRDQGCNGIKGSFYDFSFKILLDNQAHTQDQTTHRNGVAILIMAYLAAFQMFGYEYILSEELDQIRDQFDFPDERKTEYLDKALYNLQENSNLQLVTGVGQPFITGGVLRKDAFLEIYFLRCKASLPNGNWKLNTSVKHLDNLVHKDFQDTASN